MKRIAIIGAGIAGLRAALELSTNSNYIIDIWDKSSSVGGRLATRRFGDKFVNHGLKKYNDLDRLFSKDLKALELKSLFEDETKPVTNLPKTLQEKILSNSTSAQFLFKKKVISIGLDGTIFIEDGEKISYDHIIVTSPLEQTAAFFNEPLNIDVVYTKKILFIGLINNEATRIEMSDEFSEQYFELSDDEIRNEACKILDQDTKSLDLKKWRYSEVKTGIKQNYYTLNQKITLAGDAFDPDSKYNMPSAWISGMKAAKSIKG